MTVNPFSTTGADTLAVNTSPGLFRRVSTDSSSLTWIIVPGATRAAVTGRGAGAGNGFGRKLSPERAYSTAPEFANPKLPVSNVRIEKTAAIRIIFINGRNVAVVPISTCKRYL